MSWFKRMICRWVREEWDQAGKTSRRNYIGDTPEISTSDDLSGDPVLNFRVYSAIGGRIVEFRRYDRIRGNHETTTYIITEDQDFGSRIAKIATMENLKA